MEKIYIAYLADGLEAGLAACSTPEKAHEILWGWIAEHLGDGPGGNTEWDIFLRVRDREGHLAALMHWQNDDGEIYPTKKGGDYWMVAPRTLDAA